MEIGIALPTMAGGFTRDTLVSWCSAIDLGPFSSISTGDRITFHNPDLIPTTAAAAVLTERVRVMTNVVVLPMHSVPLIAKQLATLDIMSGGRLTVGVGIGGRAEDYRALGADLEARHRRLDDAVGEVRRLWAGTPPFDGSSAIGPEPVQPGGPPILAGALGPRALQRAARWADGVTGFSIGADRNEIERINDVARRAWAEAGRSGPPRLVNGTFYVIGTSDPLNELRSFAFEYLRVFGESAARGLSAALDVARPERLRAVLEAARAAGCDEFILVPGTVDPSCLEATIDTVERFVG
jgi:alkanesulfonate monooxygenase SsuD/methylene tetrahydromethanopterin reductase-like flavin-dependent oxidoreductase (luciferase family)